jgi:L-alanine-DL-glutamate epimerase-like enolase superfamily enzyme
MVEHIVLFKVKPEYTEAQVDHMIERLRSLRHAIPGIVDLTVGKNISPDRAQGFNVGLVVRFTDREALAGYGPHPNHVPVKKLTAEMSESLIAVDYEI